MATIPQCEDPWRVRPRGGGGEELLAQKIELIQDIIPLDAQVGVLPKKTVPDALHQAMFGQEPTAAQLEHTYAILDAAKVPNLLEMLEDSGLEYRCLFTGEAQDDLGQVAPWIVRLEEGSSFTRNLFTRGDAPWCLWDAEAGIYVRSIAALDEVWRHFRKFTRVQDNTGKWYLFRYWEPDSVVFATIALER